MWLEIYGISKPQVVLYRRRPGFGPTYWIFELEKNSIQRVGTSSERERGSIFIADYLSLRVVYTSARSNKRRMSTHILISELYTWRRRDELVCIKPSWRYYKLSFIEGIQGVEYKK